MIDTQNKVSDSLLATANGTRAQGASSIQETQDRFITLLVTQMKNQDPLNPLDNAQVTSQLAQLSTVTGIDKLNKTMESMIGTVQASQSIQASSLIGKTVLVQGNKFAVSNGSGAFGVVLPSRVDDLSVQIKDSAGRVIRNIPLGIQSAGTVPVAWDGFDDNGTKVSDGIYTVGINAVAGGKAVDATALTYAGVGAVSTEDGVKLQLDNGMSVSTTDIRQIL